VSVGVWGGGGNLGVFNWQDSNTCNTMASGAQAA
jgi:hypothetical protein